MVKIFKTNASKLIKKFILKIYKKADVRSFNNYFFKIDQSKSLIGESFLPCDRIPSFFMHDKTE